jgi:predicted nucleic acid-binding protein
VFWDSSALVPILLPEARSDALTGLLVSDKEAVMWWATPLEVQSALYRRHRESPLPSPALRQATDRLRAFVEHADSVSPTDDVRHRAGRLVAVHPLRAADALQLAAALIWCEDQPQTETFVSLDERLRAAASKEGFSIAP